MLYVNRSTPSSAGLDWPGLRVMRSLLASWDLGGPGSPLPAIIRNEAGGRSCKIMSLLFCMCVCGVLFFFLTPSICLKLSNNFSSSDLRAKLFSEHAGCCSPVATAAALVTRGRATSSARSLSQPPRAGASGHPPPPTRSFSGLGLGVSPLCFVRERLFFQGTTNLGGELPYGPPGEAAHGGEAI